MVKNSGVVCFGQISWGSVWRKAVLDWLAFLQKQDPASGALLVWFVPREPGHQLWERALRSSLCTRWGVAGHWARPGCAPRGWATPWSPGCASHWSPAIRCRAGMLFMHLKPLLINPSFGNLCFHPSSLYSSWISWSFLVPGLKIIPGSNLFLIWASFVYFAHWIPDTSPLHCFRNVVVTFLSLSSLCPVTLLSLAVPILLAPQSLAGGGAAMSAFHPFLALPLSSGEAQCSYFRSWRLSQLITACCLCCSHLGRRNRHSLPFL